MEDKSKGLTSRIYAIAAHAPEWLPKVEMQGDVNQLKDLIEEISLLSEKHRVEGVSKSIPTKSFDSKFVGVTLDYEFPTFYGTTLSTITLVDSSPLHSLLRRLNLTSSALQWAAAIVDTQMEAVVLYSPVNENVVQALVREQEDRKMLVEVISTKEEILKFVEESLLEAAAEIKKLDAEVKEERKEINRERMQACDLEDKSKTTAEEEETPVNFWCVLSGAFLLVVAIICIIL